MLGLIGELHPAIGDRIKARSRIVAAEISFDALWRLCRDETEYRPVGKYPAITRDLAVRVPDMTKTEEIQNIIEIAGGTLLADSDLFDYFQDEALGETGEKSLAFHLIFQSPERTLTDAEVDAIVKKIITTLEEKGWEVRN